MLQPPGYKARDVDFHAELARRAGGAGALATTDSGHIAQTGAGFAAPGYRMPTTATLDGNTVELAVEQVEFAENALRQQASPDVSEPAYQRANERNQGRVR